MSLQCLYNTTLFHYLVTFRSFRVARNMSIMLRNAIILMFALLLFTTVANSTPHVVGGASGWTYGVDYEAWASRNPIYLGDTLLFYYLIGYHSVLLVSKQDYDTCTTTSPIGAEYSGSTIVTPLTVGKTYIICGTPGLCERGMKLEINTLSYYSTYSPPPPPRSYYSLSPPPPTPVTYYSFSPPPPPPGTYYSKSPPSVSSPPPPVIGSWQRNSANEFSSVGCFVLTLGLLMLGII